MILTIKAGFKCPDPTCRRRNSSCIACLQKLVVDDLENLDTDIETITVNWLDKENIREHVEENEWLFTLEEVK